MIRLALIVIGSTLGIAVIFLAALFLGLSGGSSKVKLTSSTYGKKGKKILVGYASRAGSTAEAADLMGRSLGSAGFIAEVRNIKVVKDLSGYDGFILGTSVRAGKLMPEFENFANHNSALLNKKPAAIFLLCMTLSKDTQKNTEKAAEYFAPVRSKLKPVSEGLFAGKMEYSKLNFVARYAAEKMVKVPEGDFRKPEEMKKWAKATFKLLK